MLYQHDQFLLANESLETGIILVARVSFVDDGQSTVPRDILGLRKQVLHQCFLARKLNFNMSLPKTTSTASGTVRLKTVDCSDGLVKRDEFDIAVQSLASDTLHNDMNWLMISFANDASVAAKESKDFGAINGVRNLQLSASFQVTRKSDIYILDLDDTKILARSR